MDEIQLAVKRLIQEERFLSYLYDDADDAPVRAPRGNATIGYGCNVQAGWSRPFAQKVLLLQVQEVAQVLVLLPWYQKCNAARRSVFIDIGFNDGVEGFVKGFPLLEKAVMDDDWIEAKKQCHVRNPKLLTRYNALGEILLTGEIGAA
jgi:hypothetical protein